MITSNNYDIESICENADSIFWTLIPDEVWKHVWCAWVVHTEL